MIRPWDQLGFASFTLLKKPRRNAQRQQETLAERRTANILPSGNENEEAAPWIFGKF